jgi:hypothetical protein
MKTLIKLALAAAITYAAWNSGNAWLDYIRLKDSIDEVAKFGTKLSDDDLRDKVVEAAQQRGVTFDGAVEVRRLTPHTYIDAAYTQPVNLLPWYVYPWKFEVHVDALTLGGLR